MSRPSPGMDGEPRDGIEAVVGTLGGRPDAGAPASARRDRPGVLLVLGAVLCALTLAVCVVSLFWTPCDPDAMAPRERFAAPSAAHLLGTDQFGRDILSRTMVASQVALLVGLGSVAAGALVGTVVGAVAAMGNRVVRGVVMRVVDGLMAFPGILLALMLVLVMGRGLASALVAIAVFTVPTFARLVQSLVLEARSSLYVKAARSYGCSAGGIVARQILPNVMPRLATQFTSSVAGAMLLEASLSFLGLGVQPPATSWGLMLNEALQYVLTYPCLAVAPGAALLVAALGFSLLGDGLNDRLIWRGAR